MPMDIEFIEHKGAYPSKFAQAFKVVSLEDPYHPMDVAYTSSYDKAVEIAEEYDEDRSTSQWGGMGMRIYEILIIG